MQAQRMERQASVQFNAYNEDDADLPALAFDFNFYRKKGNHVFTHQQLNEMFYKDLEILGPDTVVVYVDSISAVVMNLHLREMKLTSVDQFLLQLDTMKTMLESFCEFDVIITCDFNTQPYRSLSNSVSEITFRDKNNKHTFEYDFGFPIFLSNHTTPFNSTTSAKMRGTHTAQQDKAFQMVRSDIDYVLFKPAGNMDLSTSALPFVELANVYVLGAADNELTEKQHDMMTTSPSSIVDHAIVVEKVRLMHSDQIIQVATFNIKGGSADTMEWAEFIPTKFLTYFQSTMVQSHLNLLLMRAFHSKTFAIEEMYALTQTAEELIKELKSPNFFSKHRFNILECHMPNGLTPLIYIDETAADVASVATYDFLFYDMLLDTKKPFVLQVKVPKASSEFVAIPQADIDVLENEEAKFWINKFFKFLFDDFNLLHGTTECVVRRQFFHDRVMKLLNYYALVQSDEEELGYDFSPSPPADFEKDYDDYRSLKSVYYEWYRDVGSKVSIADMMKMLVARNPEVRIIGFQEFPVCDQILQGELPFMEPPAACQSVALFFSGETPSLLMTKKKSRGAVLEFA